MSRVAACRSMLTSGVAHIMVPQLSGRWQPILRQCTRFAATFGDKDVDLRALRKDVEDARKRVAPRAPGRPYSRQRNDAGNWRCYHCGSYKERSAFNARSLSSDLPQSYCRECQSVKHYLHRSTLRGCVQGLLSSSRYRASQRGSSHTLVADDLLGMLLEQEGRCFYSGVPLNYLQPNSHWRISLERISNASGYTLNNCVLIAAEFNTSDYSVRRRVASPIYGTAQLSKQKVQHVQTLRQEAFDIEELSRMIQDARGSDRRDGCPRRSRCDRRVPNAVGEWKCSVCLSYKPPSSFYARRRGASQMTSRCKACHLEAVRYWKQSLRGNM